MSFRRAIIFLSFIFICGFSMAHDASLSYSTVTIDSNRIALKIAIPMDVLNSLLPKNDWFYKTDSALFVDYFNKKYIITNENKRCKTRLVSSKILKNIHECSFDFEVTSDETFDHISFNYNMIFEVSETHENISQFIFGEHSSEIIFSKSKNTVSFSVNDLRKEWGLQPYGKKNISSNQMVEPIKDDSINQAIMDDKIISQKAKEISRKTDSAMSDTSKINQQLFKGNETWNRFKDFFIVGVEHILTGYDHILFLLALLLMITSIGNLIRVITAFTIAHSITLSMAVLGYYALPSALTESMIALSISFVAFENLYIQRLKIPPRHRRKGFFTRLVGNPKKRWRVTFLFGLIHGFGFSTALRELGMPVGTRGISLFSFNLGVEAGQLMIVAAVVPLILLIKRKTFYTVLVRYISILIGVAGLVLAIQRIFFS